MQEEGGRLGRVPCGARTLPLPGSIPNPHGSTCRGCDTRRALVKNCFLIGDDGEMGVNRSKFIRQDLTSGLSWRSSSSPIRPLYFYCFFSFFVSCFLCYSLFFFFFSFCFLFYFVIYNFVSYFFILFFFPFLFFFSFHCFLFCLCFIFSFLFECLHF